MRQASLEAGCMFLCHFGWPRAADDSKAGRPSVTLSREVSHILVMVAWLVEWWLLGCLVDWLYSLFSLAVGS